MDSRGGYVSKILYGQNERIWTLGGGVRLASANVDPPMMLSITGSRACCFQNHRESNEKKWLTTLLELLDVFGSFCMNAKEPM